MKRKNKAQKVDGFSPISFDDYVISHCQNNPDDKKKDVEAALREALDEHRAGKTCECGNPLWVIGSSVMGHACFTCITLEAMPDSDYEIDEALEIRKSRRKA